jgi:hypothetical protein
MSLMPAQRKRIGYIDAVISTLEQAASSNHPADDRARFDRPPNDLSTIKYPG